MSPRRLRYLLFVPLAALLFACASTPPQATVQVFTAPPQLPAGATYRYERLPSQVAQPRQNELEASADALLARAGLRRDDAAARLAVQLTASQDPVAPGWGWGGGPTVGIGIGGGGRGGGVGIGLGFPIGGSGVQASQRVDVQMRDLATGQVVFQSQASGGAGASPAALVEAALRDFPNSPPGARQLPLANAAAR
jgi:hypothetical protein